MFENLVGNEKVKEYLNSTIENKNISHSFIFVGKPGIGKKQFAHQYAEMIMCLQDGKCDGNSVKCDSCIKFEGNANPDYAEITPDGKTLKIEQIRNLQARIVEKPITSRRKVYVIDDADLMSEESQNCLLKTLEEPPEYVTIILICSNEDNMLSTIKSRCTRIHFENLEISEVKGYIKQNYPEIEIDDSIINLSQGSIGKALKLNENKTLYENIENILKSFKNKDVIDIVKMSEEIYKAKEEIYSVLEYMNVLLLKLSKEDLRYINAIDIVEETKKRLKANSNYDMCIDNLLFNINYLFRK